MKVEIKYCVPCGYLPRATALATAIRTATGADVKLVDGVGGEFEVTVDGKLVFSKKELGRMPEAAEILSQIHA